MDANLLYFSVVTCDKPTVENGAVSPTDATVNYNTAYTVTCSAGYEITNGSAEMMCGADGALTDAECGG